MKSVKELEQELRLMCIQEKEIDRIIRNEIGRRNRYSECVELDVTHIQDVLCDHMSPDIPAPSRLSKKTSR